MLKEQEANTNKKESSAVIREQRREGLKHTTQLSTGVKGRCRIPAAAKAAFHQSRAMCNVNLSHRTLYYILSLVVHRRV